MDLRLLMVLQVAVVRVLELDLRLTLETDDGALIHMTSFGLRHGPPEVVATRS
jgi:hypothetical protein